MIYIIRICCKRWYHRSNYQFYQTFWRANFSMNDETLTLMNAGSYETKQILLARLKTQTFKYKKVQIEYIRNDKSLQVIFFLPRLRLDWTAMCLRPLQFATPRTSNRHVKPLQQPLQWTMRRAPTPNKSIASSAHNSKCHIFPEHECQPHPQSTQRLQHWPKFTMSHFISPSMPDITFRLPQNSLIELNATAANFRINNATQCRHVRKFDSSFAHPKSSTSRNSARSQLRKSPPIWQETDGSTTSTSELISNLTIDRRIGQIGFPASKPTGLKIGLW